MTEEEKEELLAILNAEDDESEEATLEQIQKRQIVSPYEEQEEQERQLRMKLTSMLENNARQHRKYQNRASPQPPAHLKHDLKDLTKGSKQRGQDVYEREMSLVRRMDAFRSDLVPGQSITAFARVLCQETQTSHHKTLKPGDIFKLERRYRGALLAEKLSREIFLDFLDEDSHV